LCRYCHLCLCRERPAAGISGSGHQLLNAGAQSLDGHCPFFEHICCYSRWGTIIAFLPLYAVQRGIANPGIFFSASAIMIMMGRALGGRVLSAFSQEKIILTFTFAGMVALIILFFTKTLFTFIFVGLLWGAGISFPIPVSMAYALDYAGSSSGTAVGTLRAISDLGLALGPIVMGMILPLTGYRALFLCLAFPCLVSLGYFQLYVRKKHDARKKPLHPAGVEMAV
jgi:MFS family permease